MRKIVFDEEELLVLAVLEPDTRKNTIARLEEILPEVRDDPDMEAIVVNAAEKLKRITDVYSHILDEDRKRNAELFEEAFYGKKNLTPQMIDAGAEKMITVPDGADAKALAKVLGNPEMMAFLTSLANTMQQ
jgi:hypothetical protein